MLGIPIESTSDVLNLAIAFSFLALVFVLSLILIRIFQLLGNIKRIAQIVEETVETVQNHIYQPIKIIIKLFENIRDYIEKRKNV